MKLFYITLSLVFVLVSCNNNKTDPSGLDWNFYLKKSQGATIKILCTIQDPTEFNYLKNTIKPLLKDSFHINALIYYIQKDKIVKTLLDDSKRNNKVVYDIVIADPDIMQSLYSLGLLYGKYLNTLPNSKDLDYTFINALNPYPVLRDYVVPYSCNQFVMLFDSCDLPNGIDFTNPDLENLAVVSSEYNVSNLYYLNLKYNPQIKQSKGANSILDQVKADSITILLKKLIKTPKEFTKSYVNNSLKASIIRKSKASLIITNPNIKDTKLQDLVNVFPMYYKMSAITNTSSNIIAAMVSINQLIDTQYQFNKYTTTNEDDLPILNLSDNSIPNDSSLYPNKINTLVRSKVIFSIADITEANKWWKSK